MNKEIFVEYVGWDSERDRQCFYPGMSQTLLKTGGSVWAVAAISEWDGSTTNIYLTEQGRGNVQAILAAVHGTTLPYCGSGPVDYDLPALRQIMTKFRKSGWVVPMPSMYDVVGWD